MNRFDGLPPGWKVVDLMSLASDISYGYTAKASSSRIGPKMLRITDIQDDRVNWDSVPTCQIDESAKHKYMLKAGDLVFARTGATVGKSFLIRTDVPEAVYASYLIRVRCLEPEMSNYLSHYFKSTLYWNQITEFSSGIGQPNVNGSKLKALQVPVAPPESQKLIVEKLDLVSRKISKCREILNGVAINIARFRQSVLAAASSGSLSVLVRGTYNSQTLLDLKNLKDNLIKAKEIKPDLLFAEPSSDSFEQLPKEWNAVTLGSLCKKITDGEHSTPRRTQTGRYLLSARNVTNEGLKLDDVDYVDEEEFEKLRKRCDPNLGDILISCSGSVGRIALVDRDDAYVMVRSAAMVRPIDRFVNPKFLMYVLQSPVCQRQIEARSKSTAQANLFLGEIKQLVVPLPPLEEQDRIVKKIEGLFDMANTIESIISNAQLQLDRLMASVMVKAFSGELPLEEIGEEKMSVTIGH